MERECYARTKKKKHVKTRKPNRLDNCMIWIRWECAFRFLSKFATRAIYFEHVLLFGIECVHV